MPSILHALLDILGLGNGASILNKSVGVLNHAALLPLLAWLLSNADKDITFHISVGAAAIIVGVAWFILELARRSNPHSGE